MSHQRYRAPAQKVQSPDWSPRPITPHELLALLRELEQEGCLPKHQLKILRQTPELAAAMAAE